MASSNLVTFQGGFVADMAVVARLIDIESRGGRLQLEPAGHFRVVPPAVLTPEDIQVLHQRRKEARAIIEYCDKLAEKPL
jgi:hypothetical protein